MANIHVATFPGTLFNTAAKKTRQSWSMTLLYDHRQIWHMTLNIVGAMYLKTSDRSSKRESVVNKSRTRNTEQDTWTCLGRTFWRFAGARYDMLFKPINDCITKTCAINAADKMNADGAGSIIVDYHCSLGSRGIPAPSQILSCAEIGTCCERVQLKGDQ
jgi:hypothetical protein